MENNVSPNIDSEANSQPTQESQPTNPIEKNRKPTNGYFIFVALILLLVWLGISVSAISATRTSHEVDTFRYSKAFINAPVNTQSPILPFLVTLCMLVIGICLFLYEKCPKGCIYVSLVVSLLSIFDNIFSTLYVYVAPQSPRNIERNSLELEDKPMRIIYSIADMQPVLAKTTIICSFTYILVKVIFISISAVSIFKIDVKVLCDITRDSCGLIKRSWSGTLFAWFISLLVFLMGSLTLNAFILQINADSVYNYFGVFTLLGGLCLIDLITSYAHMVISEYAINNFYMKGEKVSIADIAVKTLSNRMGTAMFSSTMFVSFICAVIKALKHESTWNAKKNFYYIVTKFHLVMNPNIPLIFSQIYGTGFLKSYEKTFDAVLQRPTSYLAMLIIIDGICAIILFGMIIPLTVLITIRMIFLQKRKIIDTEEDTIKTAGLIFYGISYPLFAYTLMITSTMKAQLINKIIISNKEDCTNQDQNVILKQF